MSTEDDWTEFEHGGQRWSFNEGDLALWDEQREEFHFYRYHEIAEPNVEKMKAFVDALMRGPA